MVWAMFRNGLDRSPYNVLCCLQEEKEEQDVDRIFSFNHLPILKPGISVSCALSNQIDPEHFERAHAVIRT